MARLIALQKQKGGNQVTAKVLSRAGKATGGNKDWYNLEFLTPADMKGQRQSVDLSRMQELEIQSNPKDEDVFIIEEDLSVEIYRPLLS